MQASCQCGNLTAEIADGAEAMTVACHCIDCQKRSGSPFGVMAYYPDASVAIGGEAREYARPTDSGHTFTTGFIKRSDLGRDRDEQRPDRFQAGQKVDAMVIGFDRSKKPNFSIKARQISEEKQAVEQYGSSDSGASLGDILGEALKKQ